MRSFLIFYAILAFHVKLHRCFITESVIGGAFLAGVGYFYNKKCEYVECCEIIQKNNLYSRLISTLSSNLFGQPIALSVLPAAIHEHVNKEKPDSPLVISLHGWTGSGKTYTSQLIAETMFKKGLNSIYVIKISPASFFADNNSINKYKKELISILTDQAIICPNSLIIIEEIDKLHPELIETMSSFLNNYHPKINSMIFIFTSNVGSDKIVKKSFEFYEAGKSRDEVQLSDFEKIVRDQIYNDESTMKYSSLITSHLISHYIPYLPMERQHVAKCVNAYFQKRRRYLSLDELKKFQEFVFDSFEWWPSDLKLYSVSGCKQVDNKLDIAIRIIK